MTRDEIRELIGGYSTGTLNEAERKILFEAALEDQDLFEELAREQALEEALEEPGAKQRLLLALDRKMVAAKPWWRTAWAWTAVAAAGVALVAGMVLMRSTAKVEEEARLEIPELPPPPAPEIAPVPPRVAVPAPVAKAEPAPQPQTPKEAAAPAADKVEPVTPAAVGTGAAPQAAAPPAMPPGAQAFAQGNIGGVAVGALTAPAPAPVPAPALRGGGGGGGGGRGGGRGGRALAQRQAVQAPRFAFDYTVTPQLVLRVLPYANGFLSVVVMKAASTERIVAARPLEAGMQTEVQIPDDSVSAMVVFSAQAAGGFGGGAGAPDPLSGTKVDPNPTANSVLTAFIRLQR